MVSCCAHPNSREGQTPDSHVLHSCCCCCQPPLRPNSWQVAPLQGTKQRKVWLISPSHLGWPVNRPRLYTIMVRKEDSSLLRGGIDKLYRIPDLTMKDMMVAPEEYQINFQMMFVSLAMSCLMSCRILWRHSAKLLRIACTDLWSPPLSNFSQAQVCWILLELILTRNLLHTAGSQPTWLNVYRKHPKITNLWDSGRDLTISFITMSSSVLSHESWVLNFEHMQCNVQEKRWLWWIWIRIHAVAQYAALCAQHSCAKGKCLWCKTQTWKAPSRNECCSHRTNKRFLITKCHDKV